MPVPAVPGRTFSEVRRQHRVVLASPCPPAECGRRLAAAARTGTGRPLSRASRRLPLQGQVSPDLIRVTRNLPEDRRDMLAVWFSGRVDRAPGGKTLLAGTVGPDPSALAGLAVCSPALLLTAVAMFTAGILYAVHGHPAGLVLSVLSAALASVYVLVLVTALRTVPKKAQELLEELNTILDSTAAYV